MPTRKKSSKRSVRSSANEVVAGGERIREGVRDIVVGAVDGAQASAEAIGKVVHEVMDGAAAAIKDALPRDRESPLREVISGLTEAATVIAESGRKSASHVVKTSRKAIGEGGATLRDHALRSTHEMLSAVESFASGVTGATRKEIERLVAEARTTGGRLQTPAAKATGAAAKHPGVLAKETIESSARLALGTTSRLMNAAGGMLSGFGDELARASKSPAASRPSGMAKSTASKGATKVGTKTSAKAAGKAGRGGPAASRGATAKGSTSTARRSKKI